MGIMKSYIETWRKLYQYREFIRIKVNRNVRIRYRRSILGFMWTMLNPLLTMLILTAVFSMLMKASLPNVSYSAFALTGILFFNLFSEATSDGINSIVMHSSLLRKIYVPKICLPVISVISALVNFMFSLIPLFAVFLFTKVHPGTKSLISILALVEMVIFCWGVTFILSPIAVLIRDLVYVYNILLMILFYGAPVFYPENIVPEKYKFILYINPLYYFIKGFRMPLLTNNIPSMNFYIIGGIISLLTFLLGIYIFNRLENHLAAYL